MIQKTRHHVILENVDVDAEKHKHVTNHMHQSGVSTAQLFQESSSECDGRFYGTPVPSVEHRLSYVHSRSEHTFTQLYAAQSSTKDTTQLHSVITAVTSQLPASPAISGTSPSLRTLNQIPATPVINGSVPSRTLNPFLVRHCSHFINSMCSINKDTVNISDLLLPSATSVFQHVHPIIDTGEDAPLLDDFTEGELRSGLWWRHLLAGAVAGGMSRTCTAPLDRLKVIFMVYSSRQNQISIMSGLRHMLQEGGMQSLWRGNGMNVIKIAPESAIKFMAYEEVKHVLKQGEVRELEFTERLVAGSSAGAFAQTCIYPMEVLKTRLAVGSTGEYKGIGDCVQQLYRREGVRCFYRGYFANLCGILPYAGIDLAVYETLKRVYMSRHGIDEDPGVHAILLCGMGSSTCGMLSSYPLALIKTKQQAKNIPDSMVTLFVNIVKTDGLIGLYRGIIPNFMKVCPAVSISYVVYEHVRKLLGVKMS